jgi:Tol biopolymer transport system component
MAEPAQSRRIPPLYSEVGDSDPAVSPDGKTVVFERHTTVGPAKIYTVALSGGNPRQVTPDGRAAWDPMWSSDGQHIIFNLGRSSLGDQVWRVPATGGTMEPETVYPAAGALSRDGRRLAYVEPFWFWRAHAAVISRMELPSAGGQVVSQNQVIASDGGNQSAQSSPDGRRIAFQSGRTGRPEIWRSDEDGSDLLQMTSFDRGFSGTPRWSPDGRWIAFDHHHETHSQIYLIDSEGPNMHAVTFPDASVGAVIVIQRPGCQKSIKKNWCVRIPFAVADEVLW